MTDTERILRYINDRKNNNEKPKNCVFQITIPKFVGSLELRENTYLKKITNILDKYNIDWYVVDTIGGAFNLNRDWIQTADIPCYVEYCGVYPVSWDPEDILVLENLDYEGRVIIKVMWHLEDGTLEPNN